MHEDVLVKELDLVILDLPYQRCEVHIVVHVLVVLDFTLSHS